MKLPSVLIFLLLLKINSTFAQSAIWQQVTIGDSTTVDFPNKPKAIKQEGKTAYGLYENGILYSVAVQTNAVMAGFTVEEKRHLYDEAVQGVAEAMNATQITSKNAFEVNGFDGLETTFTSTSDKFKNPVVMRMILVNDTFYGLTFSAPASSAHTAARQRFFASFATRLRPVAVTSAETRTPAYKIGKVVGRLLVYGGVIAGIILLLLRYTRKTKNTSIS